MMRGPAYVAAAVRRSDGSITTRVEPFTSILKKRPYLNIPFVRGMIALVEMLKLGTGYLNWSSNLALEDEKKTKTQGQAAAVATVEDPLLGAPLVTEVVEDATPQTSKPELPLWLFMLTAAASFSIGIGLFVFLPNLIADWVVEPVTKNVIVLNLVEGLAKLAIFVAYVWLVGRRKHIKRVFEYHGAEHKVVYAVENDCPLTPAGARPFDTPHPRCGTGFALTTVFVSVLCFTFLPWFDSHFLRLGTRLALMPIVAGISYEIIKATVNPKWSALATFVVLPGMWLQRLTTEQPDDEQLEVACEAMRVLLDAEHQNLAKQAS